MRIFTCIISGDEMFSDSFKVIERPDDIFYEVEGKHCSRKDTIDGSLLGANESAEEACEGTDDPTVKGVDICLNHSLQQTQFDKKSFVIYIKEYVKAIKVHLEKNNPERVEDFVSKSPAAIKGVITRFDSFEFFTGQSMNPEGMVGMLDYREDGITPYMLFFKDGLISEKF